MKIGVYTFNTNEIKYAVRLGQGGLRVLVGSTILSGVVYPGEFHIDIFPPKETSRLTNEFKRLGIPIFNEVQYKRTKPAPVNQLSLFDLAG